METFAISETVCCQLQLQDEVTLEANSAVTLLVSVKQQNLPLTELISVNTTKG